MRNLINYNGMEGHTRKPHGVVSAVRITFSIYKLKQIL